MKTLIAVLFVLLSGAACALELELVTEASSDALVVIRATGKVEYDEGANFRALAARIKEAYPGTRIHVILESNGGSMMGGIMLGTAFRDLDVSTGVAENTICASACTVAWFGGTKNGAPHAYRHRTARLGLHQPATKGAAPLTEAEAFDVAGTLAIYWSQVNANVEVLGVMLRTPNDSMTWLPYQVPSHNQ